jgi:hypothetical protein
MMFAPAATAREISTDRPRPSLSPIDDVCSTMTTASAPAGTKPPVEIATASPAATAPRKTSPMGTVPTSVNVTLASSDAARTSAARTA